MTHPTEPPSEEELTREPGQRPASNPKPKPKEADKLPPGTTDDSPGAGLLGLTDDVPEPNEPG